MPSTSCNYDVIKYDSGCDCANEWFDSLDSRCMPCSNECTLGPDDLWCSDICPEYARMLRLRRTETEASNHLWIPAVVAALVAVSLIVTILLVFFKIYRKRQKSIVVQQNEDEALGSPIPETDENDDTTQQELVLTSDDVIVQISSPICGGARLLSDSIN